MALINGSMKSYTGLERPEPLNPKPCALRAAKGPEAPGAHSHCSAVMLPRLAGMVPLSWLLLRSLYARAGGKVSTAG